MLNLIKPKEETATPHDFKGGELVDIKHAGEWSIGYAHVNRFEPKAQFCRWSKKKGEYEWYTAPAWIWTMVNPAHDGVRWSYAAEKKDIRKSISN